MTPAGSIPARELTLNLEVFVMEKEFYWKGDKAEYTGKSEILHGARCFEIRLLEGNEKGKLKYTYRCPDCLLSFGQDKPANAPCHTCNLSF